VFSIVTDDQGYRALPVRAVKLHHGRRRDCDAGVDFDRRVTRKVKEMLSQFLDRLDWLKRDISARATRSPTTAFRKRGRATGSSVRGLSAIG
jgi:hypothetical protein